MHAGATDVLIRGAGPVGCALALALRDCGLQIALLGRPARVPFRPVALSYASRLILERLGVWSSLAATPIEAIHVSQQGGFGKVRMDAFEVGVPALGYVTEYSSLLTKLQEQCRAFMVGEALPARCIVHAEGVAEGAREKRYAQDALVALIETQPPATVHAFERFTAEGPLALLPFDGRYALVWSCRPRRAAQLAELREETFLQELAAAAGSRAGVPLRVHSRAVQPLTLRVRPARIGEREVYIGNAAQTLHPVAGQGLNLGLRDAWDLAAALRDAKDPGSARTLSRYAASRQLDARATVRVTDTLASLFVGANPVLRTARGAALAALDMLPGPRRFFARRMVFGPSALP